MAKVITQTTVKILDSQDRIAVKAKFVNGQELLLSATRNGDRASMKQPAGLPNCSPAFNKVAKHFIQMHQTMSPVVRAAAIKEMLEKRTSIEDAAQKL